MRPSLTKEISMKDFKNYYWLKEELQSFCRENNLSVSGSKIELSDRIETFLATGEIKKPIKKLRENIEKKPKQELSLDTVISEHHRCSQDVRAFFKTLIPKFHFSTYIQDYFKNNIGKTYRDAVDAWYEEDEKRRDHMYKKEIAPQFEYNQFIRDYFSDRQNQGKSHANAIEAWNKIKRLPGNNEYTPKKS